MNTPPMISVNSRPAWKVSAAWAFTWLLCLLGAARVSVDWNLPLPLCGLKRLTGIPCPFCGSTRSVQAFSNFDFVGALRWNPLTFLACIGVALWFALWSADGLFRQRWQGTFWPWLTAPARRRILVGIVALNWIYLCLTLP